MSSSSSRLRALVWGELLFACALLAIWLFSPTFRGSANLEAFFLYGIPCEFLVSVAPHDPAVLYVAKFHAPLVVALVAGGGTLVAEIFNYQLLQHLGGTFVMQRAARSSRIKYVAAMFHRAPFVALWTAGFVPFLPFSLMRVFVVVTEYPRTRYLAAAVSSRTARFYLVALAGTALQLPSTTIVVLVVVLTCAVTFPAAYRLLTQRDAELQPVGDATLDDPGTAPHTERGKARAP